MNTYDYIGPVVHRTAWRVYKYTGINLHKVHAMVQATLRASVRPFDRLPLRGVGAEIGVYRGIHASEMLKRNPAIDRLILCDAYKPYPSDPIGQVQLLGEAKASCAELLRNCKKTSMIYENSPECVDMLPELDFCYIDGAHDYESVKRDIAAVWPIIKRGGVMGGHDFAQQFPGVIKAVTEFAASTVPIGSSSAWNVETPDWWIWKS